MTSTSIDTELLENNLRCKIIYYSCINSSTISDLNKAWGYSSPTYLYQKQSMKKLKDAGMITVEKQNGKNLITSNYDALFNDEMMEQSRQSINLTILKEYLIQSKGFHPGGDHPDLESLLEMGRNNLEPETSRELREMEFTAEEYEQLESLWRSNVFKNVFLALDTTSKLLANRKDKLLANPLTYLFKLTAGIISSINKGRGRQDDIEIPPDLRYRAEKIIVPVYRKLEELHSSESFPAFTTTMSDTYSMFRNKFKEDRYNHDFMKKFVDLTIKDSRNRNITDMFDSYKDRLF